MEEKTNVQPNLRLVDGKASWEVGEELIHAVIAAAVGAEERRPGVWQEMIEAIKRGAAGTEEGTVNAFLFRAMVDRLLEEFHRPHTG